MIALIACSKTKLSRPAPAAALYLGALFQLALEYARALQPGALFVLSAWHHVVLQDAVIEPYDRPMASDRRSREQWAAIAWLTLERASRRGDTSLGLAPQPYCAELSRHARRQGASGNSP